jgi:hypothetical protein
VFSVTLARWVSSGSDHQIGASCEEASKIADSSDDLRKLMEMVLLNKERESRTWRSRRRS